MSIKSVLRKISPTRALKMRRERVKQREIVSRALSIINEKNAANDKGIFIDCGFNTRHIFDQYYEELGSSFQFYGFEIQQLLYGKAIKEQFKYAQLKPEFIHAAVANHNGSLNYFEPKSWGVNYKGGASIVEEKNDRPVDKVESAIQCIDFSEFLASKATQDDFVVVKMDIEGAEYEVLEKVIADGHLALIDILFIEFHSQYLDSSSGTDWAQRHNDLIQQLEDANIHYYDWI